MRHQLKWAEGDFQTVFRRMALSEICSVYQEFSPVQSNNSTLLAPENVRKNS